MLSRAGWGGPVRRIRVLAAATMVLTGIGLQVLGAQAFAVGLLPPPWDKLAHLTTFAVVGMAAGLASGRRGWRRALCCLAGALLIGSLDEWHQTFLPGRSASWSDLAADAAGGLLGAGLLSLRQGLQRVRSTHH